MQDKCIITATSNIYMECNLHTLPLNCFDVIQHYGFKIFSYSQLKKENRELYILCSTYSDDAFMHRKKHIVAYNDKKNYSRIRFSVMHELGHHILGHIGNNSKNEDEADSFASHILAPRILIHKYGCKTADEIHDIFGLSYAASNRALTSYKEWFREISHSVSQKPSQPELELEEIFFPAKKAVQHILDNDDCESEFDPVDKYLYILRILKAGLPLPEEYRSIAERYRRMGMRLV